MTIEERISVVETKVTSNERLLQKNSEEHKQILDRINELEISLLVYRRIVYFAAAMIGGTIGLIFKYWDFIIHRLGH